MKTNLQSSIINRQYLYLTVFVAGMSTLAIEFTTSRMLQTVYGTSNIVWANVIGLVLLALTLGYFIGGRWADKRPFPSNSSWKQARQPKTVRKHNDFSYFGNDLYLVAWR